jgi:hypothetical protein
LNLYYCHMFPMKHLIHFNKLGQYVILCPFKPHTWHAYVDVFCGFLFSCATSGAATIVCFLFFFFCMSPHCDSSSHNLCNVVSLSYIALCFCWCYLFSIMWYSKCTPCFYSSHVFFT